MIPWHKVKIEVVAWPDLDPDCTCILDDPFDGPLGIEHTCPYKMELYDDSKTKCTCCKSCRATCAEEV